jgi:PAS domain-containing protein
VFAATLHLDTGAEESQACLTQELRLFLTRLMRVLIAADDEIHRSLDDDHRVGSRLEKTAEAGLEIRLLSRRPCSNPEGCILLVNAQTGRLFGYSRAELIGRAVEMLVPPQFRGKHTEHPKDCLIGPRVRALGTGMDNA